MFCIPFYSLLQPRTNIILNYYVFHSPFVFLLYLLHLFSNILLFLITVSIKTIKTIKKVKNIYNLENYFSVFFFFVILIATNDIDYIKINKSYYNKK